MLQESMEAYQALSDGQLSLDDATSVVGVGMAALGAFLDPAGALVGAALGPLLDWVAANVSFVKEPLDFLLGDPPEIMAYSQAWAGTAQALTGQGQQHVEAVRNDLTQWTGPGYEAFIKVQINLNKTFGAAATLCGHMSTAVQAAGVIVGVLRELVWGTIKDLIIGLVTNAVIAAASAIPSFGASLAAYTAWASAKVAAVMSKIASGISKVFAKLSKLTSKIGPLSRMFQKASDAFARMATKFAGAAAGGAGGLPGDDDPPKTPETAPSPPFGEPEPLGTSPNQPLSADDHPYLAKRNQNPETQAVPGPPLDRSVDSVDVPEGWPDPSGQLPNFDGAPTPDTWPAGETRYRVVGDEGFPAGDYWTTHPPGSDDTLRSGLAVRNEWNGNHGVVSYTPSDDIPVWSGRTGAQNSTAYSDANPTHLPGGAPQIWVDRSTFPQADMSSPDRWRIQRTPWSDRP